MRKCQVRQLGRVGYGEALAVQQRLVAERKYGLVPDHLLLRPIGRGAYGEVWLARNVMGALRAVKVIWRRQFESDRPYDREFAGIQRYEPVSRSSGGLVHVLHVGRNDPSRGTRRTKALKTRPFSPSEQDSLGLENPSIFFTG